MIDKIKPALVKSWLIFVDYISVRATDKIAIVTFISFRINNIHIYLPNCM